MSPTADDGRTFATHGGLARYERTLPVLGLVADERIAQFDKFGEQNHRNGTGWAGDPMLAVVYRNACNAVASQGRLTWRHILAEEYHEALAETDPAKLRAELVQVAAVAVAWVEAIDRRTE